MDLKKTEVVRTVCIDTQISKMLDWELRHIAENYKTSTAVVINAMLKEGTEARQSYLIICPTEELTKRCQVQVPWNIKIDLDHMAKIFGVSTAVVVRAILTIEAASEKKKEIAARERPKTYTQRDEVLVCQ